MFSRFWRTGNPEVCAVSEESTKNEEKKEKVEETEVKSLVETKVVEANKAAESPKVEEIAPTVPTSLNAPIVVETSESKEKTETEVQKPETSNTKPSETRLEGSSKQNGEVVGPAQAVTKISGPKGRRPSVDVKSPTDSRRSSISMASFDSSSRRGSVVSPLGSFSNIQERIQALCQEQTQSDQTPKKAIKVRKLSQEALQICESSSKISKTVEPVKLSPKINSNLQSKIMKFGAASSSTAVKKPTETNVGPKDDANLKEPTAKVSSSIEKTLEMKSVSENRSEILRLKPGDVPKDTISKSLKSEVSVERNVPSESSAIQEKESNASVNSSETSPIDKNSDIKPSAKSQDSKEPERKDAEKASETKELGSNKCEARSSVSKAKKEEKSSTKVTKPNSGSLEMKNKKTEEDVKAKKSGLRPSKKEILQKEVVKEAKRVSESVTMLTNQVMEEVQKTENNSKGDVLGGEDKSETSEVSQSGSESLRLRKDSKKVMKKLKGKSNPNECYPKSQKMLASKPINAYEQANLEESKREAVVSPTKVEAFLRDTLSPPLVQTTKEPVKTIEAVVEEILTSKSEKSKHEKPIPQVKYSSKGEVITGVVSIKPSSNTVEEPETLSAITLVPAFRPENSILNKDVGEKDGQKKAVDELVSVSAVGRFESEEKSLREELEKDSLKRGGSPFSSASDFSDDSYDHYIASVDYSMDTSSYDRYSSRRSLRSCSTPRRIFPQIAKPSSYRPDRTKEDSPVVIDASLSFDLSLNRTSVRHRFKPQPAFTERKTNSNSLSLRIAEFLNRTDHIMEEWKHLGKGGDDLQSLVQLPAKSIPGEPKSKSKSATNIMIKGLLNYSKGSSLKSRTGTKTSENYSDRTISDIDELSEMTMDLSEERANGTMQSERLEAETAERVRLEQELSHVQNEKKNLQQTSERLEMELFYARADVNGLSESEGDLEDGGGDAALYKNKCERAMRELEFTRRRLQQQHEDDLEQLVGLKKQLEKKLTDAYEEVEEQRQVAAQWKRKVQKLQSEMNDLRLLLEEQSSRNNLLEKKQRKFDSEIQMLQEELRSEKNQKDRLSREKEMAFAEKYSMEQNLSSVRLELELKEEKVSALTREVEELTRGGGSEQEVTQLRKAKHDLEMKLKEQEEELDELAGQVSMLEGNKLRLEMSLESLRKEHRREMAQRDDELDEARSNAQKKVKMLESQLESEHEERTLLVREKHELERRLADAEERGRHYRAADEDALQRARRDLKKTKALLRDAQVMLERAKQDSPSKAALRALKNQLEDAELARASAVKARQTLESELSEVSGQLEEALRAKGDAENRCQAALRETNALRTQVDENEEELAEVLKKYRQAVQQLSAEQLANQETAGALAEVEAERNSLKEQLAELTAKLEANAVVDPIGGLTQKKLEIRIKELESRLELEQTTRARLEVQIARLKENVERLNEECVQARTKEQTATDLTRKLQRSLREAKEELAMHQAKEQEGVHKRKELEKRLETAEQEASTARTDLRLAVKRIEDLQSAISGEIGSDSERSESDEDDSGEDSLVSHLPSTLSSRPSRTPELTPR